MTDSIKFSNDVLTAQIQQLKLLSGSSVLLELAQDPSSVVLPDSSGDCADIVRRIDAELAGIVKQFYRLLEGTTDYLTQVGERFTEVDGSLAKQLEGQLPQSPTPSRTHSLIE